MYYQTRNITWSGTLWTALIQSYEAENRFDDIASTVDAVLVVGLAGPNDYQVIAHSMSLLFSSLLWHCFFL